MPTTLPFSLSLSNQTVTDLKNAGMKLYFFRQSATSTLSASPLVLDRQDNYLSNNPYNLDNSFQAYISTTPLKDNAQINPGSMIAASPGQTVIVDNVGTLSVQNSAPSKEAIYFSLSNGSYTAGLMSPGPNSGQSAPFVGFNLVPNLGSGLAPKNTILMGWSASSYSVGSLMAYAPSQCLLLNLDLCGTSPNCIYNSATGWDCSLPGSSLVPAYTPLKSVLILSPGGNQPYAQTLTPYDL